MGRERRREGGGKGAVVANQDKGSESERLVKDLNP